MSFTEEETAAMIPSSPPPAGGGDPTASDKKLLRALMWLIALGVIIVMANVVDIEETSSTLTSLLQNATRDKSSSKAKKKKRNYYYTNKNATKMPTTSPLFNLEATPQSVIQATELPATESPDTTAVPQPALEPAPEPQATEVPVTPVPQADPQPPEPVPVPQPATETIPQSAPEPVPQTAPEPAPGTQPQPAQESTPEPKAEPLPAPEPQPAQPQPAPVSSSPEPQPAQQSAQPQPAEATALVTPDLSVPRLYIHVIWWMEGMAAWRISLEEVISMAKAVNGIFVEPCVVEARLRSCATLETPGVRLGDILDLEAVKRYHPQIVSFEEFVQATGYDRKNRPAMGDHMHYACLNKGFCNEGGIQTTPTYRDPSQKVLQTAAKMARSRTAIYEVLAYKKFALVRFTWYGKSVKDLAPGMVGFMQNIGFPPAEYARVEDMLENKLNITKGARWAALQWRPEIEPLDYTHCAEAILWARDHISQRDNIPETNFVLMSPLSNHKELQWGGVKKLADKHADTSYPALNMLLDAGFKKLEAAYDNVGDIPDGGFLAIWDFILAEKADTYSTCSGCRDNEICSKCTYQGSSAAYVLDLRKKYRKRYFRGRGKTDNCWPQG